MKSLCLCRVGGEWASKQPAARNQERISSATQSGCAARHEGVGASAMPFFALDNDIRQHVKRLNAMYINLLALIVF